MAAHDATASTKDATATPSSCPLKLEDVVAKLSALNMDFHHQQQYYNAQSTKIDTLAETMQTQYQKLHSLITQKAPLLTIPASATPVTGVTTNTQLSQDTRQWHPPPSHTASTPPGDQTPRMRVDAPRFSGTDPVGWIFKIQKYFDYFRTPEADRFTIVAMLIDNPASEWYRYYQCNHGSSSWMEFLTAVKQRFDPDHYADYIGLLSNLKQTTTLLAYQTEFEAMLNKVTGVEERILISIFRAGLKQPLQREVTVRNPPSLAATFALARELSAGHQELIQTYAPRRAWNPPQPRALPPTASSTTTPAQPVPNALSSLPIVRLSRAERQERSQKGLCWNCDEQWNKDHRCKSRFLALLGTDDDDEESEPITEDDGSGLIQADFSLLHTLAGSAHPRSLKIAGNIMGTPVQVLVDGGSTHNFIHPTMAETLSLMLHPVTPFRVYVGNGESLRCAYICPKTALTLQGHTFHIDLYVLSVHGLDVVLGVQWLQTLGKVYQDYSKLTLEFSWNGTDILLHGDISGPRPISYNHLSAMINTGDYMELYELIHLPEANPQPDTDGPPFPADIPPPVADVLRRHARVFAVPTGLPPARADDHRIHLLPNAKPVNVRPYRYPYFQKTEIERQVREMLDQGIIRHSQSAFSSPVLLVRKKDGTFRFCIDYRALNAATVPDQFPIPTADELFDELGSARFFTKLDLRSGYHQIRMAAEDIHKTAFRTHDGHYEFLVMPFGLTNAPSTFQAAMNKIFQPLLRSFVIVFFDDILIYSPSLELHSSHLDQVLTLLADQNFFVKLSKCSFSQTTVDYLGHIVTAGELHADPDKIAAMVAWPTPSSLKQLRGFLGLTGYYRRFIKHYASIAAPLTALLKKDAFEWSPAAAECFDRLKHAMTTAPVLKLPDFTVQFVLETDASDDGIGAVLLQLGHPIAFFSKKLGPRRRSSSTYHKELYAIVEAVQKWRQYLLGREFIIRSDQRSLKELLTQVIQTPDQHFYVRKLMGFQFTIEYKTGASNKAADALSRRDSDDSIASFQAMVRPIPAIMETIRVENATLDDLRALHTAIQSDTPPLHFSVHHDILYYKTRICIGKSSVLRTALLHEYHASPIAGHGGVERTFRRLATVFYWPNMRKDVKDFVASCHICQTTKYSTQKQGGLLQPLPIPERVWDEATMDFITGLPPSQGSTVLMVVVDRLTKYTHMGPLPTDFDAPRVARLFIDTVVKHHGYPLTLISDRDPVFQSLFWTELLELSNTSLRFSTAYHPQTDGQTEVLNRGIEQYLRAFTQDRPKHWVKFLPWAELSLNSSHNESIGMAPFTALYGRPPPTFFPADPSACRSVSVAELVLERQDLLASLKGHLSRMQQRMRDQANRHRRDVVFAVNDWVLLKLRPYRQHSVAKPLSAKLGRRFYGPFQVLERIGAVAYRLQLPEGSRIHNVFHVSLLRPYVHRGASVMPGSLPDITGRGQPIAVPTAAIGSRTVFHAGNPVEQWRIRWSDNSLDTWEPAESIRTHFPDIHLEDKAISEGGGVDTGLAGHEEDRDDGEGGEPPSLAKQRASRLKFRSTRLKDFVA